MTKVYRPRTKALYSLQFFRDKQGTPWLTETGNSTGKKGHIEIEADMVRFGRLLAERHHSKKSMLTRLESICLQAFFRSYLRNFSILDETTP